MMRSRIRLLTCVLLVIGCEADPDLPEDPPLVVPGFTITDPPAPGMPGSMAAPPEIEGPELAVPGYDTIPPPPMPQMPPGAMPGGPPPGTPIPIASGFTPDPMVLQGVAGGQVSAAQMASGCTGFINTGPSHVINVTAPFPRLRLIVTSQADTTLIVRGPDQQFRCDDDTEGVNPVIDGPFPPGPYTIWVGTYAAGTPAPYALGITVNPVLTAAQLAAAAPPPGTAPGAATPMQPNPG